MSCGGIQVFGSQPIAFEIREGDLLPNLRVQVLSDAKAPADLSAAVTVEFFMVHQGTGTEIGGEMTITNATNGECTYVWQAGDTDIPGLYIGRIVATFGVGKVMTFPTCPEKGGLLIEVCD